MTTEPAQVGWGFWLRWVLANTLGFALGFALGVAVVFITLFDILPEVVGLALFGAIIWAVSGLAQWLVLRRHLDPSGWWILVSSFGGAVGFVAYWAIPDGTLSYAVNIALFGLLVGAAVGLAQWQVLRRYLASAGWWVLACSVGGSAFWGLFNVGVQPVVIIIGLVLFGAIYGAVTGATLVWLLRNRAIS